MSSCSSPSHAWLESACPLLDHFLFYIFVLCCQMCKGLVYPCSILPCCSPNYCGKAPCSLQLSTVYFHFTFKACILCVRLNRHIYKASGSFAFGSLQRSWYTVVDYSLFYIIWYVIKIQLHYWAFLRSLYKQSTPPSHSVLYAHNYSVKQCSYYLWVNYTRQTDCFVLSMLIFMPNLTTKLNDDAPLIRKKKHLWFEEMRWKLLSLTICKAFNDIKMFI